MKFLLNILVLIINMITALMTTTLRVLVSPQAKRTLWYFIEFLIFVKAVTVALSLKGLQLLRRAS